MSDDSSDREQDGTDRELDRESTARTGRGRHGQTAGQGEDGTVREQDRERTAQTGRGRHRQGEDGTER